MNILWICNIMPSLIAKNLHLPEHHLNGWINVLADVIGKNPQYSLTIMFPIGKSEQRLHGQTGNISYCSFYYNAVHPEQYESGQEVFFEKALTIIKPNLIHIWGSEYPHTLSMLNVCEKKGLLEQTIISIQGLISVYTKHYYANLPQKIIRRKSFRDFIRHDGIREQKKKFSIRGTYEINALKKAKHVIGRTEWDFACVKFINPSISYHQANEILRSCFYEEKWELKNCQRYSIFVSQWEYPIKGFHTLLTAFKNITAEFPLAKLIATGRNLLKPTKKDRLKQTYYDRYLLHLIKTWGLEKNIIFLGHRLNETEMRAQYLHAHVFALPSAIENSPNSMGEAMLLGTPVVAANVGGVSSMLTHNREGFLYPFDEPYMLEYYIKKIFQHDELAEKISLAERMRASKTHNIQENTANYLNIYHTITKK